MKNSFNHGLGVAIAGALLTSVFFVLGFHSDIDKMRASQVFGIVGYIAILIVGVVLAIRARRAESRDGALRYGEGVGTGVMTSLFAGLLGGIFTYIYGAFINPTLHDLIVQLQLDKMAERGMPPEKIEQAERMVRMFSGPAMGAINGLIISLVLGLIIALIASAFLRRSVPLGEALAPAE